MEQMLYTQKEVAEILKTNRSFVAKLRTSGKLKFLKIGEYKCRRETLIAFLERWEGYDITDPNNIRPLEVSDGT